MFSKFSDSCILVQGVIPLGVGINPIPCARKTKRSKGTSKPNQPDTEQTMARVGTRFLSLRTLNQRWPLVEPIEPELNIIHSRTTFLSPRPTGSGINHGPQWVSDPVPKTHSKGADPCQRSQFSRELKKVFIDYRGSSRRWRVLF